MRESILRDGMRTMTSLTTSFILRMCLNVIFVFVYKQDGELRAIKRISYNLIILLLFSVQIINQSLNLGALHNIDLMLETIESIYLLYNKYIYIFICFNI